MILLCFLLFGIRITCSTDPIIPGSSPIQSETKCYGQPHSIACQDESYIGITAFNYGFKPSTLSCPLDGNADGDCCVYNATTDCLQTAPTESRYVDELSGKLDGVISTSSVGATSGEACKNGSFSSSSVYSILDYICIPDQITGQMCTGTSINITDGDPVYIKNRNYPDSGILNTDTSCDCSIEALGTSTLQMFILHMDLSDTPADCQQSLVLTDGPGLELEKFQCEGHPYNTISKTTLNTSYVKIAMLNNNTVTNTGKFLLAFQGCNSLSNPSSGVVNISSTSEGGVATYTCDHGYSMTTTGNTRLCQQGGTWSGVEPTCEPIQVCNTLSNPPNGVVHISSTSQGGIATYTCNHGYSMTTTDNTRVCQQDGTWSGVEPTCEPIQVCNTLSNPSNGVVHISSTSEGGVATYTCNHGYSMATTGNTRVCQQDGTWSGVEPTCEPIQATSPDDDDDDDDDVDDDGAGPGLIIGIVAAVLGVLVILIGIAYKCGLWKQVKKYVINRGSRYRV